jgi:AraC family transcriptional regulator
MPRLTYQDVYPTEALLRSSDVVRPRAAALLNFEFFEAEPAAMPTAVFDQHHLLLNLKGEPHRVENWRDEQHRDFIYLKNEIVLTPAGIRSGWRWHARSKVIVVTIAPDKLERFARAELGVILTVRQLRSVPQGEDADLCQAGVMLLDALQDRTTGFEVMYESLARIFLVKLLQRYGEQRDVSLEVSRRFTASHYKKILEFVQARFDQDITIEDMARRVGMSTAHFSRMFKQVLGDSPYQFVMDYRIERAKDMLLDRERPLIEIALACGFADQPHFNRVFKRLTGQTPRQFRASF